ncbi:GSCOCG00011841001-RA-CDS [Cotesia congregata]|nr:GSCOCG00011841001-RA-CDS [Cotesia congregata]
MVLMYMIKRQRFSKLPTQANYYPLPVVGYIQDKQMRLTVVTGQPLGAASMPSGQFEIMQDRRLIQEDHRGLGQGVTDNLLTNHLFMFVLEKKKPSCSSSSVNHPAGALSVGGLLATEEVLHPLIAMHPNPSSFDSDYNYKDHFTSLSCDLPIDLTVANLRVFSIPESYSRGIGIILHRQPIDTCYNEKWINRFKLSNHGKVNIKKLFKFFQDWMVNESSLTFNSIGVSLTSPTVNLCPHELSAFIMRSSRDMNKIVNIV